MLFPTYVVYTQINAITIKTHVTAAEEQNNISTTQITRMGMEMSPFINVSNNSIENAMHGVQNNHNLIRNLDVRVIQMTGDIIFQT